MKFDWYQARIQDHPATVAAALGKLGHVVQVNDRIARMYRYTNGLEVVHKDRGVVARMAYGGEDLEHTHAWATGDDAAEFADLVRGQWPDRHLVTRADVSEDFIERGGFGRLRRVCRRVAKGHRLSFPMISDALRPEAGRTQYMGAPSSEYRARLYEKGYELLAKSVLPRGLRVADINAIRVPGTERFCHPSELVRLELQARPKEMEGRQAAALATPEQLYGFTNWAHELHRDVFAMELERMYMRHHRMPDDERQLRWVARQYGRLFARLAGPGRDYALVGQRISDAMDTLDRDPLHHAARGV